MQLYNTPTITLPTHAIHTQCMYIYMYHPPLHFPAPPPPPHRPTHTATLSEGQRAAIHSAATAPIVVITGGPGCGKTQVVGALVHLWQDMHKARVTVGLTKSQREWLTTRSKSLTKDEAAHDGPRSHIRLAAPTGT